MNLFKFFFQFFLNAEILWLYSNIFLLIVHVTKIWIFIWLVVILGFIFIVISGVLFLFWIFSTFVNYFTGYNGEFKLSIPGLVIKHIYNYPELISNYFSASQGLQSEDFLPPFLFGYRNYFFSRIIGWAGTWASYLKRHRRRIRSSIFEWGYKNRVPTYHYYVQRGGLRIQILVPNNFKRITGSTYSSPTWFHSFPVRVRKFGFRDDIWDEDNWEPFGGSAGKRLYYVYRSNYNRPRYRNWKLSAWVEKWAPTLSPTYSKADYVSAIDINSPYSYFNYFNSFPSPSHMSLRRELTNFGFESKIAYRHYLVKESLNPKVINYYNKIRKYREINLDEYLKAERSFQEIGDYEIIDVEGLKIKKFKVAYALYLHGPVLDSTNFEHKNYFRYYMYQTILEFCTIFFESFYIYPFEIQNFFIDFIIKPSSFSSFKFEDIFEFMFNLDQSIFFIYIIMYLIIAVLYFLIFLLFIYCFLVVWWFLWSTPFFYDYYNKGNNKFRRKKLIKKYLFKKYGTFEKNI